MGFRIIFNKVITIANKAKITIVIITITIVQKITTIIIITNIITNTIITNIITIFLDEPLILEEIRGKICLKNKKTTNTSTNNHMVNHILQTIITTNTIIIIMKK